MGTSKKRLALTNLQTALNGITTVGGYANTVASVSLTALDFSTARQEHELPAVGIAPGEETIEHTNGTMLFSRLLVTIEFVYEATTQAACWDSGESLIDDIIAAVSVDPTRGGYALDTHIMACQTDAGNPDIADSAGGTAGGYVRLEIVYYRTKVVS